jgi:hypothetical protein
MLEIYVSAHSSIEFEVQQEKTARAEMAPPTIMQAISTLMDTLGTMISMGDASSSAFAEYLGVPR